MDWPFWPLSGLLHPNIGMARAIHLLPPHFCRPCVRFKFESGEEIYAFIITQPHAKKLKIDQSLLKDKVLMTLVQSIQLQSHEKVSPFLFIYALNWPISNIQETIQKMQNSQFFYKFLIELLANFSEKGFDQKFSFPWILQVVKFRCFPFH